MHVCNKIKILIKIKFNLYGGWMDVVVGLWRRGGRFNWPRNIKQIIVKPYVLVIIYIIFLKNIKD